MQIGVVFPQTEIASDPQAVRSYATGVEAIGYAHLLAYDHVLGADPEVHEGWNGPYDIDTTFHEPFVLFGYLAAVTELELVTGIIILPQRQTALVAKQAAEVDLLTNGRFRFGIGIGWNRVEYEALGKDFSDARCPERSPGRAHAPALDRADRPPRGRRRADRRRRPRPAPRATPHPDLVRCRVPAGLPPSRPPRRRLVPPGPPGPAPRRGPRHRGVRRGRGRARPGEDRPGGPGDAGAPAASSSSSTTSAAGGTRERPTSASTRWGPASATSMATSACWPRWRPRSHLAKG